VTISGEKQQENTQKSPKIIAVPAEKKEFTFKQGAIHDSDSDNQSIIETEPIESDISEESIKTILTLSDKIEENSDAKISSIRTESCVSKRSTKEEPNKTSSSKSTEEIPTYSSEFGQSPVKSSTEKSTNRSESVYSEKIDKITMIDKSCQATDNGNVIIGSSFSGKTLYLYF